MEPALEITLTLIIMSFLLGFAAILMCILWGSRLIYLFIIYPIGLLLGYRMKL
ncbi:MAG: hypothetical protein RL693_909 [Verrucomicrobiota bacterium]|jgi:hypothetical protein